MASEFWRYRKRGPYNYKAKPTWGTGRYVGKTEVIDGHTFPVEKKSIVGKRYGRLVAIKRVPSCNAKVKGAWYQFKCDCGNVTNISKYAVTSPKRNTRSCGCLMREAGPGKHSWQGYGEISGTFFKCIKARARAAKLEFKITIQSIWRLFLKQKRKCALSGLELKFNRTGTSYDGNASVDRVDSSKGYTKDNIQWVHKEINRMKGALSDSEFGAFCRAVSSKNECGDFS